ncbi:hypothetical protein RCL_jg8215.t1 [Rhizophagus clarus]|uniref:Uncharacterized protein n=1 Tax=Rhizophagus clarus TaxID=94130 RepID=A0A8H3MHT0_9GLOM|nr:hypothetical protein RCL_jg8215.t1 [Rhizophagus clarus]
MSSNESSPSFLCRSLGLLDGRVSRRVEFCAPGLFGRIFLLTAVFMLLEARLRRLLDRSSVTLSADSNDYSSGFWTC